MADPQPFEQKNIGGANKSPISGDTNPASRAGDSFGSDIASTDMKNAPANAAQQTGKPVRGGASVRTIKPGGKKPKAKAGSKTVLIIVGVGVALALGLAGYFLFTSQRPVAEDVEFSLLAPDETIAS